MSKRGITPQKVTSESNNAKLIAEVGYSKLPNALVDSGLLALMKGSEIKTYAVILRHAQYNSRQAFPSLACIVREAGICRRVIQSSIDALLGYGLIKKHRFLNGKKFRCVYTIIDNPKIVLPNKPQKMASWEGRERAKTGKFTIKPQKVTCPNKPQKVTDINKPQNMASKNTLKKTEINSDQSENAPSAPSRGNGSGPHQPEPSFISEATLRAFLKDFGRAKTLALFRKLRPYQAIPEFLLGGSSDDQSPEKPPMDHQSALDPQEKAADEIDTLDNSGDTRERLSSDQRMIPEDSRNPTETNPPSPSLCAQNAGGKGSTGEKKYNVA
ncbi:MAG: hypothetical protein PHX45_00090 [Acidobacteriota bacterium]|nr:hypothetical protein [Acidobacteriota bacterium]